VWEHLPAGSLKQQELLIVETWPTVDNN